MDVDQFGNVYFGLNFDNIIKIDDLVIPKENDGSSNLLIVKYTSNGELDWGTIMNGTSFSRISSINFADNKVVATGRFLGTLDFGDIELYSTNTHGFVAVLEAETNTSVITDIKDDLFKVYPNPTNELLTIKLKDEQINDQSDIKMLLIDNLGRKTKLESTSFNENEIQTNVGNSKPGIYYLQLIVKSEKSKIHKVIITD